MVSNFGRIITLNLRTFLFRTFEIFSRGIIFLKKIFLFFLTICSTLQLEFSVYIKLHSLNICQPLSFIPPPLLQNHFLFNKSITGR